MISLYSLISITSLLSLLQSFGLSSLLGFGIDLMVLIYMIHTFLRSTIVWKSMNMNKSPFNEISNDGYFYCILVLSITLLAVNLVLTTSFDGTILALMDTGYTILFVRYIYLYGQFLNSKKISSENTGNFKKITDMVKEEVGDFASDVKETVIDIKENINEKIEEIDIDEKIDVAKKNLDKLNMME